MHRKFLEKARINPVIREAIHDLRNLFGIVVSARNLLGDDPSGHLRTQILEAIEGAAMRGGQLTTQLLAAGGSTEALFDINHHLCKLEPMLRAIAGGQVALRLDLALGSLTVRLDPDAFEAAVFELVTNARSACADGGTIAVRTRGANGRVRLVVADDGCGMDAAALGQCLAAHEPGAHGTGIGRVRQFAASAEGRFHIRSRRGRGTTVGLELPTVGTAHLSVAAEGGGGKARLPIAA